jgi:hypothetical protein
MEEHNLMIPMKTVVLYGNSLLVSSFGASLQACLDLNVLPLDAAQPGTENRLRTLQPDIVIFDRTTEKADLASALWKVQPGAVLVGVDADSLELLVLSRRLLRALNGRDFLKIIQNEGSRGA